MATRKKADAPEKPEANEKEPAEIKEETPPPPLPEEVEVKLVGADQVIVGPRALFRDHTRRVLYAHYLQACAANPGTLHVRRVGETEYRETL